MRGIPQPPLLPTLAVRNHLPTIVAKLNTLNRADVARLAIETGWI